VIHSGAGTQAKTWPSAHWYSLINRLSEQYKPQFMLVGCGSERRLAKRLAAQSPRGSVVDWTGQLSVVELAALLERSDLFIGLDSGPAHLAAAVGIPVVVLFSGTNTPQQWQPHGERVLMLRNLVSCSPCHREHCPLVDHRCMSGLAPERVAHAVDAILATEDWLMNNLHTSLSLLRETAE
jgi:ADP-heptose:LPS heptosyltransferase